MAYGVQAVVFDRRHRAFLVDMDGVLFHGRRSLPGAAAFLDALSGLAHCFVTNNPIRTPEQIAEHFEAIGLPGPPIDRIVTSADATAQWLSSQNAGFRYLAIGGGGLAVALADLGIADDERADFVVVGEGRGIDFEVLTKAINLVFCGARLVCTNPDHSVDATVDGKHRVLPGGGALGCLVLSSSVQFALCSAPCRCRISRTGKKNSRRSRLCCTDPFGPLCCCSSSRFLFLLHTEHDSDQFLIKAGITMTKQFYDPVNSLGRKAG